MGELLLVTVVTSFTTSELQGQLDQTRNAELVGHEPFPKPWPTHLDRLALSLAEDEDGLLLHFAVKTRVPVQGDGPIAYMLETRRKAALQIAGG